MSHPHPFIQFNVQHKNSVEIHSIHPTLLITPENAEAWYRYLAPKLEALITPEAMNTPEFQAILSEIAEEENRATLKTQHKTHCAHIPHPKISYIPEGDDAELVDEYSTLIQGQIRFVPNDRDEYLKQLLLLERWGRKSIPQITEQNRPDATYAIALTLCRNLPEFLQNADLQPYHATVKPRLRKLIYTAFEDLAKSASLLVDNEKKQLSAHRLIREQAQQYNDFRGLPKKILALLPTGNNTVIPHQKENS